MSEELEGVELIEHLCNQLWKASEEKLRIIAAVLDL